MYIIILLLVAVIHQSHGTSCFEEHKFNIPKNVSDFGVFIKKDNQSLGVYRPDRHFKEIYYYRIVLKITSKHVILYFKASKHDPRGHYEVNLLSGLRLGEFNITKWPSERNQNQAITTITKSHGKYTCNTHNPWTTVLWYIFRNNETHIISKTGNMDITDKTLGNFTKLYCNLIFRCQVSNIITPDGTTALTWETDFRPDPAVITTPDTIWEGYIHITPAALKSSASAKSASVIMIILLLIN